MDDQECCVCVWGGWGRKDSCGEEIKKVLEVGN